MNRKTSLSLRASLFAGVTLLMIVTMMPKAIAISNCGRNPDAPGCGGGDGDPVPKPPKPPKPPVTPTPPPIEPPVANSLGDIHVEFDKSVTGALPPNPPVETTALPPKINPDGTISEVGTTNQPLTAVSERMWNPGQTLRVRMTGGTANVRSKVRAVANEWTQYANIHFDFVDDSQPAEIKISFDKGGSWSVIGRTALLIPFNFSTMNFGWFDDNTSDAEIHRVVLHEFGHALGLVHEHQSPVAGIQWDREKTYAYFIQTQNWDRGEVDRNVFNHYNVNETNYSQFDPQSIMLYGIPNELTLDGHGTSRNSMLSAIDKQYIAQWYPFPPKPGAAQGQLRTGDDCDQIDFRVDYNAVAGDKVAFELDSGVTVSWWKSIEIPIGGSEYTALQTVDNQKSMSVLLDRINMDSARPIRFNKAKFLGRPTPLGFRWDVLSSLPGGSKVTLNWVKDTCAP